MLQLQTKRFDIGRISKLLVKHNIKASISNQLITLDGEISDELLDELCDVITICNVQNFDGTEVEDVADVADKTPSDVVLAPQITEKYDLLYSTVKRGEVYLCDFGEPYGSEQGKERYAIIVQNDDGNLHSPTTIVCNITNGGMAYLVPITKVRENLTSLSYLTFDAPDDVVYNNDYYTGGTALLDKGRYLRAERFHEVIGKATPEFFAKVLDQLSTTFDFTGDIIMNDDDTESNPVDADNSDATTTEPKPKKAAKKVGSEESALLNVIGNSLKKLDCTKTVEEQVEIFLTDIGMTVTEKMVTQSFVIACDIKKITYENVILELRKMFPKVKEDKIKSTLKENFKEWLNVHPELEENCHNISLMSILKIFAKRFA